MLEHHSNNVEKSIDEWNEMMQSFGLGSFFDNDLAVGNKGNIPKDHKYGSVLLVTMV